MKSFRYLLILTLGLWNVPAAAQSSNCGSNQACLLYLNLTSVIPNADELAAVQKILDEKSSLEAATYIANTAKEFVNVTLRNFSDSWSHVDGNPGAPLNATSATIIATVVQELDFRTALYEDVVAQGNGVPDTGSGDKMTLPSGDKIELPFHNRNTHYEQLEKLDAYHKRDSLVLVGQTTANILRDKSATAGILTSRGFASQAFQAGTNRRMVPMLLREGLCIDIEEMRDPKVTETYILRDVGKKDPDGSVTTFKAVCKTCHGMMDQLATAAIYHDYRSNSLQYDKLDPVPVTNKMMKIVEPTSHIPRTDEWRSEFTEAQLTMLELDPAYRSGFGLKSLGKMIANSNSFAKCQVKKAYYSVCGAQPSGDFMSGELATLKTTFNIKNTFIRSAVHCAQVESDKIQTVEGE